MKPERIPKRSWLSCRAEFERYLMQTALLPKHKTAFEDKLGGNNEHEKFKNCQSNFIFIFSH
jgi:hypothetical protein